MTHNGSVVLNKKWVYPGLTRMEIGGCKTVFRWIMRLAVIKHRRLSGYITKMYKRFFGGSQENGKGRSEGCNMQHSRVER